MDQIIEVWFDASSLAHPFLEEDFVAKVKKDMREIYIPNNKTWVYEQDGKIIGFISMMGNEIGGLFVQPSNHSKGIGTLLVDFVKPMYDVLEVEVFEKNSIGRAFYDKYGFKQIKNYYHEESACHMLRLSL